MRVTLPAAVDRLHERVFVAAYARVQRASEEAGMREIRRELVSGAAGRVLEVGAGTGLNLEHYGPAVAEVVVSEPSAEMRAVLGAVVLANGDPRASVVGGGAERLPFADSAFDAVVGTFVLCSVEDPAAVLREISRVLRPGGRYLALEHVRAGRPGTALAQRAVAPLWRWAVRGCRCDQDAHALLTACPLALETVEPFAGPRQPWPVRPGLRIVARAPGHTRLRALAETDAELLLEATEQNLNWRARRFDRAAIAADPALAHYGALRPDRGDFGLVAETDGHVEGVVWLLCLPPEAPGYGFVDGATPELSVSVRSGHRGRGLGRRLMLAALAEARARGHRTVSLSVEDGNPAAALYRSLGFVPAAGAAPGTHLLVL